MKKIYLLCCLFTWVTIYQPIEARATKPQSTVKTIAIEDAFKYIGCVVKLNCDIYKTVDDGKILTIYMNIKHPEKSLMLMLTGERRKTTLDEMRVRRRLNTEIKQPLDTSITATGKIVLYNNSLRMVVSHASDVYLGPILR